jgi:hypothetical protein
MGKGRVAYVAHGCDGGLRRAVDFFVDDLSHLQKAPQSSSEPSRADARCTGRLMAHKAAVGMRGKHCQQPRDRMGTECR